MHAILVPDLGAEARLSHWYVQPGEQVALGDRVAELLIPGVTIDVSAPASGTLVQRQVMQGEVVRHGSCLGIIQEQE